MRNRRSCYC